MQEIYIVLHVQAHVILIPSDNVITGTYMYDDPVIVLSMYSLRPILNILSLMCSNKHAHPSFPFSPQPIPYMYCNCVINGARVGINWRGEANLLELCIDPSHISTLN